MSLQWGEAPVAQVFGTAFNIFAWLLPAVGAVTMLGLGNIDGGGFTVAGFDLCNRKTNKIAIY